MYILKKEGMGKWISFLREKFTVFAPVFDGVMVMRVLMDEKPVLENRMRLPPKCIIFPQTEKIFGFSERLKVDLPKDKILLLGVRPCDARSLKIFDEMFMDDPYYLARRENLLIIALSCNSPGVNCFCTSVGGSPFSSENADLLLTDLGDCYYVDVLSGRRRELIGDFDRAEEEHERRKEELKKRAEKNMKRKVNTDIRKILQKLWNSPLWEEVARRCISCGICPTSVQHVTVLTSRMKITGGSGYGIPVSSRNIPCRHLDTIRDLRGCTGIETGCTTNLIICPRILRWSDVLDAGDVLIYALQI
jgi:hypothetical protein